MRPTKQLLPLLACILLSSCSSSPPPGIQVPIQVPIDQLGERYQLVGKLGVPMGKPVRVEGVVVEGFRKGYEGGPNLLIQRINGQAVQGDRQIRLAIVHKNWGSEGMAKPVEYATYEMEGYESGYYVGIPHEVELSDWVQTCGFYFHEEFAVYKCRRIQPVVFGPADFPGQKAFLKGTARSEGHVATIQGTGWSIIVDADKPWAKDVEGKLVEAYAKYVPAGGEGRYKLEEGSWTLVRLEDQLGKRVELRGIAVSLNGHWWFRYRGQDLYVDNMDSLPGWNAECHWQPMIIRGVLGKAEMPDLDQITIENHPRKIPYFIVHKPNWEPTDALPPREWPDPQKEDGR